jgi:hypothetical protein
MPVMARKVFRLADWLSAFCLAAFLCVAPSAAGLEDADENGQTASPAPKKKIALAQFEVANTLHVDDISNIYDSLPVALGNRLEAGGHFLTAYTGRAIPQESGEAQRKAIIEHAARSGAQFLISGVLVNAGTTRGKGYLGTSMGEITKRHAEVELAVHDGHTGNRLLLRRFAELAEGEVSVGNDKPFDSSLFLETEFGKAMGRLLDSAAADIQKALESVPFTANVVSVSGNEIIIDAGSHSLLRQGDELVAYASGEVPVPGLQGGVTGITERAADVILLNNVQQEYARGELTEDAAKQGIKAGSLARIDPEAQRVVIVRKIAAQQQARAEQEAKEEAERLKAKQAAEAEAARLKAEQEAKAEAARIKAEKKAKAQAAAEAKKKAAQQASAARVSAAQKARERAARVRAALQARQAKPQALPEAERTDVEQQTRADVARIRAENKAKVDEKYKAEAESPPPQAAASGVAPMQGGTEAESQDSPADAKKKQGTLLKLKPIKP